MCYFGVQFILGEDGGFGSSVLIALAVPPCGESQQLFATSLLFQLFLLFLFCELILDDEGYEEAHANACSDNNPKEDIVLRRQPEEDVAKSTDTQTYEDTAPS